VSLHRTAWGDPTNDLTDDMRLAIARLEGLESWFGSVLPVVYERILEDSLPSSGGGPVADVDTPPPPPEILSPRGTSAVDFQPSTFALREESR
jgi:hypothetical protein